MNIRYSIIIINLERKIHPSSFSFLPYLPPVLIIQLYLFSSFSSLSLFLLFFLYPHFFYYLFVSCYFFQTILLCGWILIVAVVIHTHTYASSCFSAYIYKYRCLRRHYHPRILHLSKTKHNISIDKIVIQLHQ